MSKTVGNYELTTKLGSGSYAHVYQAVNKHTRMQCAIKVISKGKKLELSCISKVYIA